SSITAVLIPKHKDVPVEMVFYYLLAHKDDILVPLMRGATNKSLNTERLAELKVPVLKKESDEGRAVNDLINLRNKIHETEGALEALREKHMLGVEALQRLRA
ncbi:MAG: restriction endonuclease subunit S, partial [Algiphilus sp.]